MSRLRQALGVKNQASTAPQEDPGNWSVFEHGTGLVTADSAMQLSAVWACLRVLSEAISTLPLDVYKVQGDRRVELTPRPSHLTFQAPKASRIEYLSMTMLSLLTDGNAFAATPRNRLKRVSELVVLDPAKVTVRRQLDDPTPLRPFQRGEIYFVVGGKAYGTSEILHIKGMTMPGELRGMSPVKVAREVIEGARKAQEFGTNMWDNAAVPPAVIEMPVPNAGTQPGQQGPQGEADAARAKRIAKVWHETHGGTSNAGKVGVLIGGAQLKTVAVTPEDAQWLETRRFGVQEIARIYGVPPHLIADSSNSTSWGSGLAEQNLAFGQLSLRPWLERIEEGHNRLLQAEGIDGFVKLNMDALLRASHTERFKSHAIAINAGFMSPNEVRALEDLPPVENGDVMLTVPVGAGNANISDTPPGGDQP